MAEQVPLNLKWTRVGGNLVESVCYVQASRKLYVKFQNSTAACFQGVPGFRYQGLLSAPRKDAYFTAHVKNAFLSEPVPL
jgi:hypothetical protein